MGTFLGRCLNARGSHVKGWGTLSDGLLHTGPDDFWLVNALGPDPRAWTTFFGLANGWALSMGELVETTPTLAGTPVLT